MFKKKQISREDLYLAKERAEFFEKEYSKFWAKNSETAAQKVDNEIDREHARIACRAADKYFTGLMSLYKKQNGLV